MEAGRRRHKGADGTPAYILSNIGHSADPEAQAQTLKNIAAVLEAAGSDFSKIVKLNVYLKSYGDFTAMNEVYITHFGEVKPVSMSRLGCVSGSDLSRRELALRYWSYRSTLLWRWSALRSAELADIILHVTKQAGKQVLHMPLNINPTMRPNSNRM
jgi:hypothetical protein